MAMSRSLGWTSFIALAADAQLAVADVLETGDHAQRGGLPAARRADEDEELAVGDVEIELGHRLEPVRVPLGDLLRGRRLPSGSPLWM